jgi:anti-repressor protein
MKELIQITKNENEESVVSARDLHQFLIKDSEQNVIGRDFSNWIKDKLGYGFVLGTDYTTIEYDWEGVVISGESDSQRVRVHKRDYVLTIDCAKQIAMIQNNDKGKAIRLYFIEVEKCKSIAKPMTESEAMAFGLVAAHNILEKRNETIKNQEETIKALQPKAAYTDHILSSQSNMTTTTIAKELGMTAMQLNRKLKEKKIQFKQDNIWVLTARFQDKSLTSFRTYDYRDNWNNVQTSRSLVWTEKGRNFLHQIFNNQLTLA